MSARAELIELGTKPRILWPRLRVVTGQCITIVDIRCISVVQSPIRPLIITITCPKRHFCHQILLTGDVIFPNGIIEIGITNEPTSPAGCFKTDIDASMFPEGSGLSADEIRHFKRSWQEMSVCSTPTDKPDQIGDTIDLCDGWRN